MEKPILKERKKIVRIGNSRGIVLPAWWAKNVEEVEMEVFADRVIIKREVRE